MSIRTRFAPSPTGHLHIGGVRTALFCWLYARKNKGQYILRIEDTDKERSTQDAIDAIIDGLQWLGLAADEEPIFQSQHFMRYLEVANALLEQGHAYRCYCSKQELERVREDQLKKGEKMKYDGCCRNRQEPINPDLPPVLRFKTPVTGAVCFDDLVYGEIKVSNSELDDFIIVRSDNTPTYNFTVVVDDSDMNISHVIRGDDHINNTQKQIHIFNALDVALPKFAHLPMINGQDGQKLSKRHGAVSVLEYKEEGFLPQALLNYLARLGWSHGDQELFDLEELVEFFDFSNVNKAAASFDREKLLWINRHHIKHASKKQLVQILAEQLSAMGIDASLELDLDRIVQVYREKVNTMKDMATQVMYLFNDHVEYDPAGAEKFLKIESLDMLKLVHTALTNIENWQIDDLSALIATIVSETRLKFPQVAQPLRIALTGSTNSPSIDQTLWLVGREKSLERIDQAIKYI